MEPGFDGLRGVIVVLGLWFLAVSAFSLVFSRPVGLLFVEYSRKDAANLPAGVAGCLGNERACTPPLNPFGTD